MNRQTLSLKKDIDDIIDSGYLTREDFDSSIYPEIVPSEVNEPHLSLISSSRGEGIKILTYESDEDLQDCVVGICVKLLMLLGLVEFSDYDGEHFLYTSPQSSEKWYFSYTTDEDQYSILIQLLDLEEDQVFTLVTSRIRSKREYYISLLMERDFLEMSECELMTLVDRQDYILEKFISFTERDPE
jgi:hypothetical protein